MIGPPIGPLGVLRETLRDTRSRIASLKDQLERAYEREHELVRRIADEEAKKT